MQTVHPSQCFACALGKMATLNLVKVGVEMGTLML